MERKVMLMTLELSNQTTVRCGRIVLTKARSSREFNYIPVGPNMQYNAFHYQKPFFQELKHGAIIYYQFPSMNQLVCSTQSSPEEIKFIMCFKGRTKYWWKG